MNRVQIDLPVDIFEQPKAQATRLSPLRMRHVRRIAELQQQKTTSSFDELCKELATVWPEWTVKDPETGNPLPNPKEDSQVFMELGVEQFQWFGGAGLVERPTLRRK